MNHFMKKSNFSPKSISRIPGVNAKNPETRAICGVDIRDIAPRTLSIYVLAVSHADQLQRSFVYKAEQHSPIPRDAERQKADERFGQILSMQKRVVWIGAQPFYQFKKLAAMLTGEHRGAFDKSRMMYNVKHSRVLSRRGTLSRFQNEIGVGASHSPHEASPARIPDGIRPRGPSRQCLSRTSGASAPLFLVQSCSYAHSIPNRTHLSITNKHGLVAEAVLREARVLPNTSWLQREAMGLRANARHSGCQPAATLGMGCWEIITLANELNRWGCSFYAGVCTSSQQRESWEVLSLTPIGRSLNTV
ncbi:MAG: hypothetical protein G01um101491_155 [Parcubacteria group bacterium Gr01-1014_91]|nr:MAG: hypothetical protein G01um101491_155 [Parcubacteria group bacterium Gr01-1014_91]